LLFRAAVAVAVAEYLIIGNLRSYCRRRRRRRRHCCTQLLFAATVSNYDAAVDAARLAQLDTAAK